MKSSRRMVFLVALLLMVLSGCAQPAPAEPSVETIVAPEPTSTIRLQITPAPTSSSSSLITATLSLSEDKGPLLLLQTDFHEYQYLNPLTQARYPFKLLIPDSQFRFRANVSPSGRHIFIPLDNTTAIIADLITTEVVHMYDFSSPELFNPELAVIEIQPWVTDMNLTQASVIEAVTQAHQNSRQLISWFQSDRFHISVQDSSATSTSLFLDDHQTGNRIQLENLPGLVEDFSVGSDGNIILLKKSLQFKPGAYQDSHYYLVNIKDQTTQPLPMPEDVKNPSVSWFSQDSIGVTHQAYRSGGTGFSIIQIDSLNSKQIITGDFQDLRLLGDYLFYIQRKTDPVTTFFSMITLEGDLAALLQLDKTCFFQFAVADRIIVQCELESFLLDQDFNIEPFFDSLLTLSPSPDRSFYVMINRSEQSFLLTADLEIIGELLLEETPLEILWLPDSSGFLYRTNGKLFHYDLSSTFSNLLIESDLFSDYTNLNAIWIKLE